VGNKTNEPGHKPVFTKMYRNDTDSCRDLIMKPEEITFFCVACREGGIEKVHLNISNKDVCSMSALWLLGGVCFCTLLYSLIYLRNSCFRDHSRFYLLILLTFPNT